MQKRVANSTLVEVPAIGHMSPVEAPHAIATAFKHLLEQ
jgi:pimeloyl-ACP methyl ester carboxylesterase